MYGSGGFTTYDDDQLRDQLSGWASGAGHSPGQDQDRRVLGRRPRARPGPHAAGPGRSIGDDVELFVDANGGYGRKQAIRVMNAAADLDVRWFEEPVSSDDLDGLREVRDGVSADVTAGEYG